MRCLSDRLNMWVERDSSNAGADMSAMHPMQRRSACLTQSETFRTPFSGEFQTLRPCSRGEQGQSLKEAEKASRKRDVGASEEG